MVFGCLETRDVGVQCEVSGVGVSIDGFWVS